MANTENGVGSIEIGILTIAERRGSVRTPRQVDLHHEPAEIERITILRKLTARGLMRQVDGVEDAVELEFVITDDGRKALDVADHAPMPPEH
jgi:hypothetical protein